MHGDTRQRVGVALLGLAIVGSFLAVDPWGWDAFGPVRFLIVPSAALLGSAALLAAEPESLRLPSGRWLGVGAAFIAWVGVTTLTAIDPLHALVGTPDRHFGFLAWLVLAIVVLAAGQLTDRSLDRLLMIAVIATAAVGTYATLELFDVMLVDRTFDASRIGGPFGQPAYLGAAMTLAVPVTIGWTFDRSDAAGRIVGALASIGGSIALLGSQSRAAWVGVGVATVVAAVRNRRGLARLPRWILPVAAAAVIATAVLTPVGDRALSLAQLDGIADSRTDEWAVATRALAANPVVGTGPEGYRIVFGEHVDAAYAIEHGRDVITDRAHSSLLDVGVTTGLPGLALYGALLLATVALAVRALGDPRARTVGLAAGVLASVVAALFLFPVAEIEVVFVIAAAALATTSHRWREVELAPLARWAVVVGAVAIAAAGVGAAVAGAFDVAADHRVAAALDDLNDPGATPGAALAAADDARRLRPDSTRYAFIASRIAAQTGDPSAALERLADGLRTSPRDPAFLTEQADQALALARASRSDADMKIAEQLSRARIAADPNDGGHHLRIGLVTALAGDDRAALASFDRAATLSPRSGEALFNAAVVHVEQGRLDEARAAARGAAEADTDAQSAVERLLRDIDQLADRIDASE